jgi:hypothetical protein
MLSKYVAGRDKDRRFNRAALRHGLADGSTLTDRLGGLPVDATTLRRIADEIAADSAHRG